MGMPAVQEWTAEMARALPDDGQRYEVLDGELFVTPAPALRHQEAVKLLLLHLHTYLRSHRLGYAMASPADIEFSPRRLVQPDVFVAPPFEGRKPRHWREISTLLLAIEVLSPTTARADRVRKRAIYQGEGIPEYWIVDLDARLLERWRPGEGRPEIVTGTLDWRPVDGAPGLTIDLDALFKEVME